MRVCQFWVVALVGLGISSPSFGMTVLKQVKVVGDGELNLVLDRKISSKQVSVEYLNDIVQISLNDTSVYPAKIIPVHGNWISKVFAYQYSPTRVRCRLSVKGKAEGYKDRFQLDIRDAVLSVRLREVAAMTSIADTKTTTAPSAQAENATTLDDEEEKALLEKVLKAGNTSHVTSSSQTEKAAGSEKATLTSGKALPSLREGLLKLVGVIALLFGVIVALKKVKKADSKKHLGVLGAIREFASGKTRTDEKLIQIVSTHYLDPKKGIAVVRVAGRLLVLGLSNESINLITQIPDRRADGQAGSIEDVEEEIPLFTEMLNSERHKPSSPGSDPLASTSSVRSRIKSRLEGLKPL